MAVEPKPLDRKAITDDKKVEKDGRKRRNHEQGRRKIAQPCNNHANAGTDERDLKANNLTPELLTLNKLLAQLYEQLPREVC